jgi:hypothetical protein
MMDIIFKVNRKPVAASGKPVNSGDQYIKPLAMDGL